MSPQFSENLLACMYVEVDDLYKAFLHYGGLQRLGRFHLPRTSSLSPTEVVTIVAAYHLSGYKCFDYYCREAILKV